MDDVLLSHPDIVEAICFEVPDEKYGEEVRHIIPPCFVFIAINTTLFDGHDPIELLHFSFFLFSFLWSHWHSRGHECFFNIDFTCEISYGI